MSLYNPEGVPPAITAGVARVERYLPYPGEVLVRTGSRVEPEDIVARALIPEAPQVMNVAQELAVPAARIKRTLRHEVGSMVRRGTELARTGLRSCLAPVSGVVSAVDVATGYVTITPDPVTFDLTAALRGIVMEIIPYRGMIIESPAAHVYGAFGVGKERSGVLRMMLVDQDEVVQADRIDASSAYAILVCNGAGITAEALRKAIDSQVRGVVLGSIEEHELRAFLKASQRNVWVTGHADWTFPNLKPPMDDPGLTIVLTEGFGKKPMSIPLFNLLGSKDRQEVLIDGTTSLRRNLHRPRVIVPLNRSAGTTDPPHPPITPGISVRLLDAAHLGEMATVRTVSDVPRRLPSGVRTAAVEVVQEDMVPFWVPQTAVEVLI